MNVLNQPLSLKEMVQMMNEKEMIEAIVPIELSKLISYDFESLLDEMSELATGSILLCDITYEVAPHHVDPETVAMKVTGDATNIIENMMEDLHRDLSNQVGELFDWSQTLAPKSATALANDLSQLVNEFLDLRIKCHFVYKNHEAHLLMINPQGDSMAIIFPEGKADPEWTQSPADLIAERVISLL